MEHPFDPRTLRLALAQMTVKGAAPEINLARARYWIRTAAQGGAQMVLLPEALDLGWTDESAGELAQRVPDGAASRALASAAEENKVYVCAGVIEKAEGQVFNSAILIDPKGDIQLHHRKLNELDIAHHCYQLGDRLGVTETPWGRIGLMICSDAFACGQVIARSLGYMGAAVILSPCAWAVPPGYDPETEPYGRLWEENYRPVAQDFRLWIAGVSNVGRIRGGAWRDWQCIGNSMVVGPDGSVKCRGPYGEEALVEMELRLEDRPARGDNWNQYWK